MRTIIDTIQTGEREWELQQPVRWNDWRGRLRVDIPPGYRFDLASVPRGLWWLIAPFELSTLAPLVHDYLFEMRGRTPKQKLSRRQVDRVFLRAMRHEGIPYWRRTLAYLGVRIGGWVRWYFKRGRSYEEIHTEIRERLTHKGE